MNPHDVTRAFEQDLCEYTGAPYVVAVNSCTMALLLCCALHRTVRPAAGVDTVTVPKRTYVGVPMAIRLAGYRAAFRDEDWSGQYALNPLPVWDAARRFSSGMFKELEAVSYSPYSAPSAWPRFQAVSFHVSKILGHSQGGAILHNDARADEWLRRARFDGRREGVHPRDDTFDMLGYHCYLSPDVAAALRWKLSALPRENADLPRSDYSDLSLAPIFQAGENQRDALP